MPTQRLGDVSLRISAGTEFFKFSNATGEFISSGIGENSLSLFLQPEYNYYWENNLSFFISFPLSLEIDPRIGALFNLELKSGLRLQIGEYFFTGWSAKLIFIRRTKLYFNFGGLALELGTNLPITERYRLFLTLSIPFNFTSGFYIYLRTYLGFEVFF